MSLVIVITGLMLVGLFYIFLKKNRETKVKQIEATAPLTSQERVQKLINQINQASETYEIKMRRQNIESRVAKRVLEISYIPVDEIQLMHELDRIATDVINANAMPCLNKTIFETINTMVFGDVDHDELEVLEIIAAKAYLKSKGRALILGFSYDDICGSTPPVSVPTGYRETIEQELL